MYRGAIFSALLHAAVAVLVIVGLPHFKHDLPMMDVPVPVDIVTVAEITNAPPPAPEEKPEPQPEPPKPEPVKPPPPPEPEVKQPEPPKPEPPKPEPPPTALAEVAPPPPKPKTKPEPPVKDVKPEKKPPPPDEMASILKTVEKLKEKKPVEKEDSFLDTAEALKKRDSAPRDYDPSAPVTISQIDAIRRHFEKCWNIPAGARDAEDLAVQIRVAMAPDATVQRAEIVPDSRLLTDGFYRAAAESALRAVLHPRCHSLKDIGLRPEQFDQWRDMVITFNPKQMIGA